MSNEPGREATANDCAGCGHIAQHHNKRRSVYAGLMANYRVVWGCGWKDCGCPEYLPPPARETSATAGERA